MVNLSELEKLFFTSQELRDIESRATANDRQQDNALIQNTETAHHHDGHAELYRAIEKDDLEHLAFLNEDITALVKIRERFQGDGHIKQMAEFLIRIDHADIESTIERIGYARQQAAAA